jgi:hypothetical protein
MDSLKRTIPFIDEFNLKTNNKKRLYTSAYKDKKKTYCLLRISKGEVLVQIQSKNEYPNYYFRNIKKNDNLLHYQLQNPLKALKCKQRSDSV